MNILELFSGSGIMSQTFRESGHDSHTVDAFFNADSKHDMRTDPYQTLTADIIWASPPCKTFSVASISTHWKGGRGAYIPKTKECKEGLLMLENTIKTIAYCGCKYWFIENPRGVMRKVIDRLFKKWRITNVIRHTVTYCQYGDDRMKPTDIWTNNPHWKPRPMCKNGMFCHVSAPRGSKTGTQGLKNAFERGKLPKQLCEEIVRVCEDG